MFSKNYRVGILGGGVIGLSSALHVATQNRNLDVTVLSDKDITQTTSYGPAGLFRPHLKEPFDAVTKQWPRDSFEYFVDLAKSADGPMAGVQLISGFCQSDDLSSLKRQESDYGDIVANFRWLDESDMEVFTIPFKLRSTVNQEVKCVLTGSCSAKAYRPGFASWYGIFYTATTAQTQFYLPWLAQQARVAGVKFTKQRLETLTEVADRFDLLINCTGLGARRLVPDETVVPNRGITVNVSAPWIKHFLLCDNSMTFILPGMDGVFLGTVREQNSWKTEVDLNERLRILNRCCEIMPSLKRASFKQDWVGLRPDRPAPRLEKEVLKKNTKSIPVIHNYGHGGNGVTLSWGSAVNVNRLLIEELRMKDKSKAKL